MAEDGGRNKRLGRGLAALIGDAGIVPASQDQAAVQADKTPPRDTRKVPIEFLEPNPRNPRKTFHEKDLTELTDSIREKGIIQPILVRPAAGKPNHFEIIAGERRWRAAQRAGLHDVPVLIREITDQEALELAIIENVQRADLNPIEEALGYEQLTAEFNYSQNDLARLIGKSRSHVANTLRLLKLPEPVKQYLNEGALTAGHARALIAAPDPAALAKRIVEEGLTVRSAETMAQQTISEPHGRAKSAKPDKDADTKALEKRLSDVLGLAVEIAHKPSGAGEVRLRYKSLDQLDEIIRRLEG